MRLPEGLHAVTQVAKEVGLDLGSAYLHLDGGGDSTHNRQVIVNAGIIPNIPEDPRNRTPPKRGRTRLCNAALHAWRVRVEPTFAWEDTCKRLLLRFEHLQQRYDGMQVMAYTLINVRVFRGT
jgi:Transposase DDE domain